MRRSVLGLVGFSAIVLAGCGEQAIFGATPATSAAECEAQFKEAMSRGNRAYIPTPTTGAGLIGAALGRGLARGNIEGAYRQCLARVGATTQPVPATAETLEAVRVYSNLPKETAPTAAPRAFCPTDAPVMYGGTQYCLKR